MKKKANQSQENINPYEVDKLSKIPSWIIVVFLKYWAAAAAVFFIAIGGTDIGLDWSEESFESDFRLIVAISVMTAIFMNYIIKQFVILMHNRRNNTYRYNMINLRGFSAFLLYLVYSFVLTFILYFVTVFIGIKGWVINPFTTVDYGIEPFTYGACFIVVDSVFVFVKNMIVKLCYRIKYNKELNDKTPVLIKKNENVIANN